jgi:hypothetical protein
MDHVDLLRPGEEAGEPIPSEVIGGVGLEQSDREGVERRGMHGPLQSGADSLGEVEGPPPREAEQDDRARDDVHLLDEVDGAPRQELRLARAGTAHDDLGTVDVGHRGRPVLRIHPPLVTGGAGHRCTVPRDHRQIPPAQNPREGW